MAYSTTVFRTTLTDVERQVAIADAALAVAGHRVTDPCLNELVARQARGELSGDEARKLGRKHIIGNC